MRVEAEAAVVGNNAEAGLCSEFYLTCARELKVCQPANAFNEEMTVDCSCSVMQV